MFNQAAANAAECAALLRLRVGNLPGGTEQGEALVEAEVKGDDLNRAIRKRMDEVIVTPFDREDIHALSEQLDDAVDHMRAVSDLVTLHNVTQPLPGVVEFVDVLEKATVHMVALVGKLSRLRDLDHELDEINRLEMAGDDLYRRTTADLFSGQHPTMDVLKWMGIVDALEDAIDAVDDTSKLIAAIALKHN